MAGSQTPSVDDFRTILTRKAIGNIRIIQLAMGSSVVLLSIVVFFLYFSQTDQFVTAADTSFVKVMTFVNLIIAAAMYALSPVISRQKYRELQNVQVDPGYCLQTIRTAMFVHLAMLESSAFLGLMTCFAAAVKGVLQSHAIYWINIAPAFLFLIYLFGNYASRDKLLAEFRDRIRPRLAQNSSDFKH